VVRQKISVASKMVLASCSSIATSVWIQCSYFLMTLVSTLTVTVSTVWYELSLVGVTSRFATSLWNESLANLFKFYWSVRSFSAVKILTIQSIICELNADKLWQLYFLHATCNSYTGTTNLSGQSGKYEPQGIYSVSGYSVLYFDDSGLEATKITKYGKVR
jgi:hypothetical protein